MPRNRRVPLYGERPESCRLSPHIDTEEHSMSIATGTVELQMDFNQPVEAVFAAWSGEEAQRVWGDPGAGWTMTFEQFRFAVGQSDICRFGPTGGTQYINENRYLAIAPAQRIVYATSLAT